MRRKSDDARRKLLDSAMVAFARKGYAGTSVSDILAATGLSKPMLYYYFESKAGLFRAILDFAFDEPYRLMGEALEGQNTTEGKLIALASVLFRFCGTHQHLTRLALATVFAAPEEIPRESVNASKRRRNFELVLGVVREGQKKGELDASQDAVDLTHGIYGSISHRIRMHLLAPEGKLDPSLARRVVGLFLKGAGRPR